MSLPDTTPIDVPEWLRPHLEVATDELPEAYLDALKDWVRGGFRNRRLLRQEWIRSQKGFARIPTHLRDALASGLRCRRVLGVLDPRAVESLRSALTAGFGPSHLAVALWLDDRETVRLLATPEHFPPPAIAAPADRSAWVRIVQSLFLDTADVPVPKAPDTVPEPGGDNPLRRELENHRGWLESTRRELREVRQAAVADRQRHDSEHAGIVRQLTTDLQEARQALAQWEGRHQEQLRRELGQALSEQVRPWLARAISVEEQVADAPSDLERLSAGVERAIARQRETDRHHGNHARLRLEIQQLQDLRDRAQLAANDALQPLGEWARLLNQLDSAMIHRRTVLRDLPHAPGWAAELATAISLAGSGNILDEVLHRAVHLAQAGLLPIDALDWLRVRAAERRSVLVDPLLRFVQPAPIRIGDVLQGRAAGLILIDAYNWIGRSGAVLEVSAEAAAFSESLRALRPRLRQMARLAVRAEIHLFADGPDANTVGLAPNLRISWSGGTGPHRADAVLSGHLQHCRSTSGATPAFVVSDDQEVRRAATRLGAAVEPCEAFAKRFVALLGQSVKDGAQTL